MRHLVRLFLLSSLILAGCGLSDYVEKMASEKERLDQLDREHELLAEPLEIPPMPVLDKEGNPVKDDANREKKEPPRIFLRPPRGIDTTGKLLKEDVGFVRYLRKGTSTTTPINELRLVAALGRKDFLQLVSGRLPGFEGAKAETYKAASGKRDVLATRYVFDGTDGNSYEAYFYPQSNPRVAIVFIATKGQLAGKAAEAIKMSLGTLGVDDDSDDLERRYNKLRRSAGGKKK